LKQTVWAGRCDSWYMNAAGHVSYLANWCVETTSQCLTWTHYIGHCSLEWKCHKLLVEHSPTKPIKLYRYRLHWQKTLLVIICPCSVDDKYIH
jgi:hypothetical protein